MGIEDGSCDRRKKIGRDGVAVDEVRTREDQLLNPTINQV